MMEKLKIQKSKVVITRTVVLGDEVDATLNQYIGFRLSNFRKLSEMSQTELGEKLGLTRVSIVNIESGRQGLAIKHLAKICEIFNIKSSEILPF